MPSKFHQFANLPFELRLKIWNHALQPIGPSRPRAHFFSVTNYEEDGDALKKLRVQCHLGSDCEINHGTTYCLAAPKFGDSHSWINNNPSAYLLDYGMWNACHESREVIEKHYKMNYWTAKLRQGRSSINDNQPMGACVPFIYPHSGGSCCFAIHPNRDLVCIQPVNASTVGFYRENPLFIEDFCMVDYMTGMRGFPNLALEYDPSWCDGLDEAMQPKVLFEEMSPRGLFVRIIVWMVKNYYSPNLKMLYLIDYNLKRDTPENSHAFMLSKKRKVFSGIDRRFVEASPNSRCYSNTWSRSALEFVDNIAGLLSGINCLGHTCEPEFGCNGCDMHGSWSTYNPWRRVRVLECEEAE
ncbi:hypothetical protein H0G86_006796 [Trichoderma simmonsii]|uniref:2EXR domain-containing protein n=1 Tax=Trichoderma simmonsii TaxID=1491479 RepID=A0A8G0PFR4_9HYPO|nr:hypothetical protein H0G86_006796 [Trichoderma simmonsii]